MPSKDIIVRENLLETDKERYDELGASNSGVYAKAVMGYAPYVDTPGTLSGQITVTTAGSPELGPTIQNDNGFMVCAHPDNTDTVWVFGVGQTAAAGFPLQAKSAPVMITLSVPNLNYTQYDADVSGEKICWIKL